MYDTLMQMGRWFGYRPRYLDLCRLYTTGRLCRWFAQIADATEELRSDFERMAAIGATPKDFGLRVRSHPEMMITADVKMRYGTSIQVTFQGAITETIDFAMAPNIVADNWAAGTALVTAAAERGVRVPETESPANWEWRDVPPGAVLAFLGKYKTHGAAHKVRPERIREYIEIEVQRSRLKRWRILVAEGGANDARGRKFDLGPASGVPVVRAWHVNGDQEMKKRLKDEGHYRIRRLVSPSHESAGISRNSPEYEDAMRRTLAAWEMGAVEDEPERKRPTEPGGRFYREVRSPEEGVLILYPLDATRDEPGTPDWAPILGFAISFPSVPELSATRVTYRCNNVFDQQERALM